MPLMPPAWTMVEPMRSSIDVESPVAFYARNPPLIDGPFLGVFSHPLVPLWRWIVTIPLFVLFNFVELEYASNAHTSICVHAI